MSGKFIHHSQSKKFLQSIFDEKYFRIISCGDSYFSRFEFIFRFLNFSFPISINYITTSQLPVIEKRRGLHLVLWDRVKEDDSEADTEKVMGWCQAKGILAQRRPPVAYLDLRNINEENYFKQWSRTVHLFRNRWNRDLAQGKFKINEVSVEDFVIEYKKSSIGKSQKKFYLNQIKNVYKNYENDIKFYFIVNKNNAVVAGVGLIEDRFLNQLIYMYVFTNKDKEFKHIGVGIIDYAVKFCLQNNINYFNFTPIWEKGHSSSWKGFTEFKLKFNPKLLRCKNSYIKFACSFS